MDKREPCSYEQRVPWSLPTNITGDHRSAFSLCMSPIACLQLFLDLLGISYGHCGMCPPHCLHAGILPWLADHDCDTSSCRCAVQLWILTWTIPMHLHIVVTELMNCWYNPTLIPTNIHTFQYISQKSSFPTQHAYKRWWSADTVLRGNFPRSTQILVRIEINCEIRS